MSRNRIVQILSVAILTLALMGSGWLTASIDQSRQALGLKFQTETDPAIEPWITIPTAAMGSFRGVAVDVLWYRAMRLQEEGKYFEANQLAHLITTLQPRFPRVWQYQAWNMAYNISVATHTPQERWGWVNKGIVLLRDKGIVYNPSAVTLYRELGWIFSHKIGKFMDEMHWYYRQQLAIQWHQLLGASPPGATTQQVIDRFYQIANAPQALDQVVRQEPLVQTLLAELTQLNYELNESLLRQIGAVQMFDQQAIRLNAPDDMASNGDRKFDRYLARVITNPQLDRAIEPFLAWLRKKVLQSDYHMDPMFMLELMQRYGPLDWRHPMSHACYWSEMGVKMAIALRDTNRRRPLDAMIQVDLLNTNRQAIHTMQALTRFGRITFDLMTGRFDLMPDPRFVPAYSEAMEQAQKHVESGALGSAKKEAFDRGHENFLLEVTTVCYLYGDLDQAQHYYKKVRDLYGQKSDNLSSGRYRMPLAEFVIHELRENMGMVTHTGRLIHAMLERAFSTGLAYNQMKVFDRFVGLARIAHNRYQQDKSTGSIADRGRLRLVPFDQMLTESYLSYMQSSDNSLLKRSRVWINTPVKLQQIVSDRLLPQLYRQATQADFIPAKMFPKPPATTRLRKIGSEQNPVTPGQVPVQIERQ